MNLSVIEGELTLSGAEAELNAFGASLASHGQGRYVLQEVINSEPMAYFMRERLTVVSLPNEEKSTVEQSSIMSALNQIAQQLAQQTVIFQKILAALSGGAVDLNIDLKGSARMNKKATGPALKFNMLKKGLKGAVMPPQTLTTVPASITLVPVDASNNPAVISPTDAVAGTLTSDSASFVIVPGADTLHYTATVPANTPLGTVVNLAATLVGTIQGSPASFTASLQLTLNIPPSPVAVDLDIVLG
jgi:hypothetical protein